MSRKSPFSEFADRSRLDNIPGVGFSLFSTPPREIAYRKLHWESRVESSRYSRAEISVCYARPRFETDWRHYRFIIFINYLFNAFYFFIFFFWLAILKGADLASTSAKKVRQELEEKLGANLQARKKEIDDLVMEYVSAKDKNKKKKKVESEEDEEEEEEEEEEVIMRVL